jgi:hypothetical protein
LLDVRIALVVPRSVDDDAVRRAALDVYHELTAAGHEVDCFVIADPNGVDGFLEDRTRLCVVDQGFRRERWSNRSPALTRVVERASIRAAGMRLNTIVARAHHRLAYDAFVQPRLPG